MKHKIIITIGRQLGSGGRIIGKIIAKKLNINYYDKELIELTAKESGLSTEVFEHADEKTSIGLAFALSTGISNMGIYTPNYDFLSNETLFQLQSDTIRNLANKESAVIVGRCADYILRDIPECTSIFIHCNTEQRIKNIINFEKVTKEQAIEMINKNDKSRSAYYNYYTGKEWGHATSYNFSIDSAILGTEESANFIIDIIKRKSF